MLFFSSLFQFIVQENLLSFWIFLVFSFLKVFLKCTNIWEKLLKTFWNKLGKSRKNEVHFPTYLCSLPPTLSPQKMLQIPPNATKFHQIPLGHTRLNQRQQMLELSQWTSSPTLGHQTHFFLPAGSRAPGITSAALSDRCFLWQGR